MSQQEFIASHSNTVCQSINQDHPDTVIAMARSFTKQDVTTASVVQVTQEGFKMEGKNGQGKSFEMSVSFTSPVHSMSMIKDTFLQMSKQVNGGSSALNPHRRREIPGQSPGLRVYWPDWTPFLVALAIAVASFFYIYFFPNTRIPLLRLIKNTVGMSNVRFCIYFAIGLHSFQTVTAWYLMKRLAKCDFTVKQVLMWSLVVEFFGIGSMLKLLPIVYYSTFVSAENDREEWKGL